MKTAILTVVTAVNGRADAGCGTISAALRTLRTGDGSGNSHGDTPLGSRLAGVRHAAAGELHRRGAARRRRPRRRAGPRTPPKCRSTGRARPSAIPPSHAALAPGAGQAVRRPQRGRPARRRPGTAPRQGLRRRLRLPPGRGRRPPTGAPTFGTTLVVRFDEEKVDDLVDTLGLPVWPQPRPKPVLWLAIDDGSGPRLVGLTQVNAARPALESRDRARLPPRPAQPATPPSRRRSARSGAATPPPWRAPRSATARRCS